MTELSIHDRAVAMALASRGLHKQAKTGGNQSSFGYKALDFVQDNAMMVGGGAAALLAYLLSNARGSKNSLRNALLAGLFGAGAGAVWNHYAPGFYGRMATNTMIGSLPMDQKKVLQGLYDKGSKAYDSVVSGLTEANTAHMREVGKPSEMRRWNQDLGNYLGGKMPKADRKIWEKQNTDMTTWGDVSKASDDVMHLLHETMNPQKAQGTP